MPTYSVKSRSCLGRPALPPARRDPIVHTELGKTASLEVRETTIPSWLEPESPLCESFSHSIGAKAGVFGNLRVTLGASLVCAQGLNVLAFLGDLFPFPFQAFAITDKKIKENPEQVKRWLRAMVQALMFIRDNPEKAADVGLKRLRVGNISKPEILNGIKRYAKAFATGVPGLPSREGIREVIEYEIKAPLKLDREVPEDSVMNLKFIEEVRAEFEGRKGTQ